MSIQNIQKTDDTKIDSEYLSKLRWRSRRGMLENDIVLTKFFDKYANDLTISKTHALEILLDLSDNDLLDIILKRKLIKDEWASDENIIDIINKLQEVY